MSKVRTSGTDIELKLLNCVRSFWQYERYRKNARKLPGKPDVVFLKSKIAIFADGDFWHGLGFNKWRAKIPPFWKKKIASNIKRDEKNKKLLRKAGYIVLRFWGTEIKKKPAAVRRRIGAVLKRRNPWAFK